MDFISCSNLFSFILYYIEDQCPSLSPTVNTNLMYYRDGTLTESAGQTHRPVIHEPPMNTLTVRCSAYLRVPDQCNNGGRSLQAHTTVGPCTPFCYQWWMTTAYARSVVRTCPHPSLKVPGGTHDTPEMRTSGFECKYSSSTRGADDKSQLSLFVRMEDRTCVDTCGSSNPRTIDTSSHASQDVKRDAHGH